ncbi:methyltransferase domain-containing protein [Paenibacillus algorifonticola]|uniref:TRM11 family SAM-dependent methyltransferase n=1 Tax=Paenibacillus algorifonticola TaxID=684063 RepID=UPI003D27BF5D
MARYLYSYSCHEEELKLCRLELSRLLDAPLSNGFVVSEHRVSPSRSPFLKRRVELALSGASLPELLEQLPLVDMNGATFKVLCTVAEAPYSYEEQRGLERSVGASLIGAADMREPERLLGITFWQQRYWFGDCEEASAVWLAHRQKPQNYSTALGTRVARAVVNIAAGPDGEALSVIDPCCGMGTVLIEALSMGIAIRGVDRNPLAVRGARVNLAHFGYSKELVSLGDMRELEGHYDAAIVDLPYNLCSVLPIGEQLDMLESVRRLADLAVIVTTEPIETQLSASGFSLVDRCELHKGAFTRFITLVK